MIPFSLVTPGTVPTALAPMQNVTDLPFMQVVTAIGGPPDGFFTEYFSVHSHTHLDPEILRSICENTTGRPVYAQILGNSAPFLIDAACRLQDFPIAGIDLNLGCPAPKVYKRNAGGGLLRDPEGTIDLVSRLREAIRGSFSVKMRTGFEDTEVYDRFLDAFSGLDLNFVTVHGRTVADSYRGEVRYDLIRRAVEALPCPVFANGNVRSVASGQAILAETGAFGLMIGRAAIRNPWIFRQIREASLGRPVFRPRLGDVHHYIHQLYQAKTHPATPEAHRVNHLKRYLVFIAEGVDPEGAFLHQIRRARNVPEFFQTCDQWLMADGRNILPFADEPYDGVVARPNQEA